MATAERRTKTTLRIYQEINVLTTDPQLQGTKNRENEN